MEILSVYDKAFSAYGTVLEGYELSDVLAELKNTGIPEDGVVYVPSLPELENVPSFEVLQNNFYGGMPIQIGFCNGRNQKLNCLEYHRDSEINICGTDVVLLLAMVSEMVNYQIDTACVKAFHIPAGVAVQLHSTTLHYAPCSWKKDGRFRVAVVLARGTNTEVPEITPICREDCLLWARNKWLLAHPDAPEATEGAYVGLTGENILINWDSDC